MKIRPIILLLILTPIFSFGQSSQNYQFKIEYIYGNILKHTKHLENLVKGPVTGFDTGIEWKTGGEKPWQQFLGFPTVGIGASYLNLSNPDTLGSAFTLYPYINIPVLKSRFLNLYIKPGAGMSYVTKTFRDAVVWNSDGSADLNRSNAAIGSRLNVYFAGSINLEIPLAAGLSLTADAGWNHISNGSIIQPNSGINMLNGFIGLKYFPLYKNYNHPVKKNIADLKRRVTVELIVSGGIRQLYYRDNQFLPVGSVSLSVLRPLSNFYRMGVGADVFYDGVYGAVNSSTVSAENISKYKRTYLTSDVVSNKIRAGISWQHELIMGKLTAGFHFGIYLYNPVKNLEPYTDAKNATLNKPIIYPYDIDNEDGWLYTRASMKYALTNHFLLSVGLKTHLQKAEFIEWGLGYRF